MLALESAFIAGNRSFSLEFSSPLANTFYTVNFESMLVSDGEKFFEIRRCPILCSEAAP